MIWMFIHPLPRLALYAWYTYSAKIQVPTLEDQKVPLVGDYSQVATEPFTPPFNNFATVAGVGPVELILGPQQDVTPISPPLMVYQHDPDDLYQRSYRAWWTVNYTG